MEMPDYKIYYLKYSILNKNLKLFWQDYIKKKFLENSWILLFWLNVQRKR